MKFIVDVNVGRRISDFLAKEGHDVVWAGDLGQETPDRELLKIGLREQRVIITVDRDFESMAFRERLPFFAVLRIPSEPYERTRYRIEKILAEHAPDICRGNVVCATGAGIRVRRTASRK